MLGHVAQSVGGALPGVGLLGFRLGTRDALIAAGPVQGSPATTGTWVAPYDCIVEIIAFGAGSGGGRGSVGTPGQGGSSGVFSPFLVREGQTISYSLGARGAGGESAAFATDGGSITVTLPDGRTGVAPGGKTGQAIGSFSEPPTGFDFGSRGGGPRTSGENGGSQSPSSTSSGGGVGGIGNFFLSLPALNSVSGSSGPTPGSGGNQGSGGSTASGNGGIGGASLIQLSFWRLNP